MDQISGPELDKQLEGVPEWRLEEGAIVRDLKFADFKTAFAFMTRAAAVAEELNHHPDWTNVYNRLSIRLSTHEAGGVTGKDFELAARLDELYKSQ